MKAKLKHSIWKNFERGAVGRSEFSNGSVHLHHRTPGMRTASFFIWFNVGSRQEKETEYGVCHLIEHLIFKGKDPLTGKRFSTLIEERGGIINAMTTKEYTCFELMGTVQVVKAMTPLFLKMVGKLDFTSKEFTEEKKVVLQEIKEDNGSAEYLVEEKFFGKCFNSDLGHPIAGSTRDVKKLTVDICQKFYKKYFSTGRMVTCFVGDQQEKSFLNILSKPMEEMEFVSKLYRPKILKKARGIHKFKSTLKKQHELSVIEWGIDGVTLDDNDRMEMTLVDLYLTDGMTSYLFKRLREEEGLIYGLESHLGCFTDNGIYSLQVSSEKNKMPKVKNIILESIENVALKGIPEEKLERMKSHLLDYWDMQLDDIEIKNSCLARGEFYRKGVLGLDDLEERLSEVSVKSLKKALMRRLEKGYSQVELRPLK